MRQTCGGYRFKRSRRFSFEAYPYKYFATFALCSSKVFA